MSTGDLRVVVVGTGFGARVVAPVFTATEGCAVVDVVSPRDDAAVAAACGRRDVDLVSVHSPPFLHAAHVGRALDAGHAVLCDKPFGRSATESAELLRAAEAAGVVHLVNFEFRFDPARARLRALVREGAIGSVEHVAWTHASAGSRVPLRRFGWLFEQAKGGGWIGAWGSHAVDALRWIVGEPEPSTVRGHLRTTIPRRPGADGALRRCDAEDGFTASLLTSDGATIALDATFAAPVTLAPRLTLIGRVGVLECVADERVVLRRDDGTREVVAELPLGGDRHLEPMRRWAEVVRDAVRTTGAPPDAPTFADGLACARVLDALRAQPFAPE